MASGNKGYWSRSWELLTRDSGWIKPVLVLAAARFVPIVGPFGADGYGLEWARLTSWGVDSSPTQKDVDISACIRTGAKAFVVSLGYMLVLGLLNSIVRRVFGATLGGIFYFVLTYVGVVLVLVANLRATIYQTIGAGYQVDRIADMVKRDYKGLLRIVGIVLAMSIVVALAFSIVFGVIVAASMGGAVTELARMGIYDYADDWVVVGTFLRALASVMPAICVLMFALSFMHSIVSLIEATAVGLWMRQFDVTNWGESSDPLPSDGASANAVNADHVEYPGLPSASQSFTSQPLAQGGQGVSQGAAEATHNASEEYAYGSRTSVWDTMPAGGPAEVEPSADAELPDIPVMPLESFGANDASAQPAASEPQSFGLWETNEAPAEASSSEPQSFGLWETNEAAEQVPADEPQSFGLWDTEDAHEMPSQDEAVQPSQEDATPLEPAVAPEPFAPQGVEEVFSPEPQGDAEEPLLQPLEEPIAPEDSSVRSVPLDAFSAQDAYEADAQPVAASEQRSDEVEMFPLFDIPAPTSTFEAGNAEGDIEVGALPEEVERRTYAERREAEPISEEDVLRRAEAVIRSSDMTAWDIPQTVRPAGDVSSFSLDDFGSEAQSEADSPAQDKEIPAEPDEMAEDSIPQPVMSEMPSAADSTDDAPVVQADAVDEREDTPSESIVESITLGGGQDVGHSQETTEESPNAQEE